MTIENNETPNRQYAANLARKYFSGQIPMHQFLENLPDYENDIKIKLLFDKIGNRQKKGWFFGVSKEKYAAYIKEVYELIEDLESAKFKTETMRQLLKLLWLQSDDCSLPISNIGIQISEIAKMTNNSKNDIKKYLNLLIDKKYLEIISDEPLRIKFTESGKKIKNKSDIEQIISNIA